MNKPFIISSNNFEENDIKETGFYTLKNDSKLNLRILNSNQEIKGIVRLNESTNTFEGYNGIRWVQFNAEKGEKGDSGNNFNSHLKFVNIKSNQSTNNEIGLLFKTEEVIINDNNKNKHNEKIEIKIRNLKSGIKNINGEFKNTIKINTEDDSVILNPNPQPYIWDFSHNNNIDYLKSNINDECFKCYGKVSIWPVMNGYSIKKGQFVSLNYHKNNLYIIPVSYELNKTFNMNLNKFMNPIQVLGVALESSNDKKTSIKICEEGITTVSYSNDNNSISENYMKEDKISKIGSIGLLDNQGYVFSTFIKPCGEDYLQVGYFLELKHCSSKDNLVLFRVKISI